MYLNFKVVMTLRRVETVMPWSNSEVSTSTTKIVNDAVEDHFTEFQTPCTHEEPTVDLMAMSGVGTSYQIVQSALYRGYKFYSRKVRHEAF